jgi:hypothetical protein
VLFGAFPGQWVKGEISGFRPHTSGHLYFKLKDASAQLDCAMFKMNAMRLSFTPRDGLEVEAYGEVSVYEPRGNYQLVIKQMRVAGIGALLAQLEELKQRLAAEGRVRPRAQEAAAALPAHRGRRHLARGRRGARHRQGAARALARHPRRPGAGQGAGRGRGGRDRRRRSGASIAGAARISSSSAARRLDRGPVGVQRGGGGARHRRRRTPIISAVGTRWTSRSPTSPPDVRAATPSNAAEISVRDVPTVHREIAERVRRRGHAAARGGSAGYGRGSRRSSSAMASAGTRTCSNSGSNAWTACVSGSTPACAGAARRGARAPGERDRPPTGSAGRSSGGSPKARASLEPAPKRLTDLVVARVLDRRRQVISLEQRTAGTVTEGSPQARLRAGEGTRRHVSSAVPKHSPWATA